MYKKDDLKVRLKKIEGQVRGISGMIDSDRSCAEIITQLLAAERGLDKVGYIIIERCLKDLLQGASKSRGNANEDLDTLVRSLIKIAKHGS
jgi:CsoR family transcriptional regulator, copper-sensing transcriptional repressor